MVSKPCVLMFCFQIDIIQGKMFKHIVSHILFQCQLWLELPLELPLVFTIAQVIFELESPNPELVVQLVDQPDFTCGPRKSNVHQLQRYYVNMR